MYSWKSDEFGIVMRAKARLFARGLGQREGIDSLIPFGGWCSRHRLFIRVLNVKSRGGGVEMT